MICLMEIWGAFLQEVVTNCSTICLSVLPSIHPVKQTAIVRPECPYAALQHQFLGAAKHLYKRVCPSVRPSVRRSVTPSHFRRFWHASEHRVASIGSCSLWISGVERIKRRKKTATRPVDLLSIIIARRLLSG